MVFKKSKGNSPAFVVKKRYALLDWLREGRVTSYNFTVPRLVVKELSALKNFKLARRFLEDAGLAVRNDAGRRSKVCNSVLVIPPKDAKNVNAREFKYVSPQIILPKVACREVPFGSVLMNVLLPETSDESIAEIVFREYQPIILKLCRRLKARPFACITGYKKTKPRHELDFRGFRLFFSSQPARFYRRILETMQIAEQAFSLEGNRPEKLAKLKDYQNKKFCFVNGKRVGHSLLDDIKLQTFETVFVDMRS